jgi:hypothetical protein
MTINQALFVPEHAAIVAHPTLMLALGSGHESDGKAIAPTRPEETPESHGRRAVTDRTLRRLGCKTVQWRPAVDLDASRVQKAAQLAAYVEQIPGRTNCPHAAFEGAVATVWLPTFADDEHYDGEACASGRCTEDMCVGRAWSDCQLCAGHDMPALAQATARASAADAPWIAALLLGDVAVLLDWP